MDRPDSKSFKIVTFVLISNVRYLEQGDVQGNKFFLLILFQIIMRNFDLFLEIYLKKSPIIRQNSCLYNIWPARIFEPADLRTSTVVSKLC